MAKDREARARASSAMSLARDAFRAAERATREVNGAHDRARIAEEIADGARTQNAALSHAVAALSERLDAVEDAVLVLQPSEPLSDTQSVGGAELQSEVQRLIVAGSAIEAGRPIRFAYRGSSEEALSRTVSPYSIDYRRGGEALLTGWDHGRQGIRRYRVDRIYGNVALAEGVGFVPPRESDEDA